MLFRSLTDTDIPFIKGTTDLNYALNQVIDGKVDIVDTNVDSLVADTIIIKNKNGSLTYDQSTDSLEAIRDSVDTLTTEVAGIPAVSAITQAFRAIKASGSIIQGGVETVVLTATEGVKSIASKIVELKVIPQTGVAATCTDFEVEVYENSATGSAFLFAKFDKARADKGDLALRLNLNFYNRDIVPSATIYVKILNIADSGSTTFDVEIRGDVLELA